MSKKTKYCDCCEEEWEEGFFCKKCSGLHSFDGEMEEVPNIFWDGNPDDEYVLKEREPEHRDICLNCCGC